MYCTIMICTSLPKVRSYFHGIEILMHTTDYVNGIQTWSVSNSKKSDNLTWSESS